MAYQKMDRRSFLGNGAEGSSIWYDPATGYLSDTDPTAPPEAAAAGPARPTLGNYSIGQPLGADITNYVGTPGYYAPSTDPSNPQGLLRFDNGYSIIPEIAGGGNNGSEGDPGGWNSGIGGYAVYDNKPWYDGQEEQLYDAAGKWLETHKVGRPGESNFDKYGPYTPFLAVGGALAAGAAAGAGTGAVAAGGTGAADAATAAAAQSAAGGLGGGAVGGAGGFIGEGVASGIPAWDAALTGAQAGGLGGAGLGASTVFNPAADSQLASSQLGITGTQSAADAAAIGAPSVTVNGAPTGSWLSNLFGSGGVTDGVGSVGGGMGSALSTLGSGAGTVSSAASGLGSLGNLGGGLGALATIGGGLLGSKGQESSVSATKQLPDYLQGPVVGDLLPKTQGLLASQMPQAQAAGQQMMSVGGGLLGAPVAGNGVGQVQMNGGPAMPNSQVAGNGYGQVQLNAPTTATNPYLGGMADDITRRTGEMIDSSLWGIRGNAVAAGGIGGSRQGVAQGGAISKGADYLAGNLANMYGTQYNNDQNRALQQYGMDQGFYGQQRGQDISMRGQDLDVYNAQKNRDLQQYGLDQNFYGQQRGQDLAQVGTGAGLLGQGFQTQWSPLAAASGIYSPYSGMGTATQTSQQGGGAMGILGGALGAAQLAKNAGWFQ